MTGEAKAGDATDEKGCMPGEIAQAYYATSFIRVVATAPMVRKIILMSSSND